LISLLGKAAALTDDKRQLLVLVCEHGPRAQLGKALLKWSGYKNVELLDGHMASWRRSGRPLHKGN
jgi:hydroxyacylglutathione hydrolase